MFNFQVYRQKNLSFISLCMENIKDIDRLIGRNLKRLRLKSGLTQDKLGELTDVDGNVIARIEGGILGMGKKMMFKLCNVFKIEPYHFYLTDKSPLLKDEREKELLRTYREIEHLDSHVADEYIKYGTWRLEKTEETEKDPPARQGKALRHKAGDR